MLFKGILTYRIALQNAELERAAPVYKRCMGHSSMCILRNVLEKQAGLFTFVI